MRRGTLALAREVRRRLTSLAAEVVDYHRRRGRGFTDIGAVLHGTCIGRATRLGWICGWIGKALGRAGRGRAHVRPG